MTYEYVFEVFDELIKANEKMEIIQLKHGYKIFLWDDMEDEYYSFDKLIRSPGEMFYSLLRETELYHNLKATRSGTKNEDFEKWISAKLNDLRKKFIC